MLVGLLIVTAPAVFSGLLGGPTNSTSHLVMPSPASTKVQCGSAEQKQALLAEAGAQLAEPEPQRAALPFPKEEHGLTLGVCAHCGVHRRQSLVRRRQPPPARRHSRARLAYPASPMLAPCTVIDADPDPAWFARRFRLTFSTSEV